MAVQLWGEGFLLLGDAAVRLRLDGLSSLVQDLAAQAPDAWRAAA